MPSPPHARIRRLWTLRYSSSLQGTGRDKRGGQTLRLQPGKGVTAGSLPSQSPEGGGIHKAVLVSLSPQQGASHGNFALVEGEWGIYSHCTYG